MEWYEAAFDRWYPVLYGHRDRDEAVTAVKTFGHRFAGKSPILDLACGDGRYAEALADSGFAVYGLDLSHYLLRRSVEQLGHRGILVQGDMRHLPFRDGCFGGAINMFTSFGYFSSDTDNLMVFMEVARVIARDGLFLFDFLNAEKISSHLLAETERRSGDYLIRESRKFEGHGKYLVKRATIMQPETGLRECIEERLRLYTRDDLVTMLRSAGLMPLETFGDYVGNEFVDGVSERVIILSEKR